jgi:hypothetical protein
VRVGSERLLFRFHKNPGPALDLFWTGAFEAVLDADDLGILDADPDALATLLALLAATNYDDLDDVLREAGFEDVSKTSLWKPPGVSLVQARRSDPRVLRPLTRPRTPAVRRGLTSTTGALNPGSGRHSAERSPVAGSRAWS